MMSTFFVCALLLMAALCTFAILGPMRLHLLTETGLALILVVCMGMAFSIMEGRDVAAGWRSIAAFGLGGLLLVFWGLHRQKAQNDEHVPTLGGTR